MPPAKREVLLLASLAALLNCIVLLLPSIFAGDPMLVLHDRRLAAFVLVVSLSILLESYVSTNRLYESGSVRWLPTLMSAAMLLVFLTSLTEQAFWGHTIHSPAVVGFTVMVGGVVLRTLAIRALGPYFLDEVIVVSGQPLVMSGIYTYVRHPSELGNLFIAFGSAFLLGSLIGLVISAFVLLPVVVVRIRLEDRLLMRHFPELFADYVRDVPALFLRLPIKRLR